MDDEALIAAYYACDDGRLVELRARHQAALMRFFNNNGAREEAEDCAQETWGRVVKTKNTPAGSTAQPFDPSRGVAFRAWLLVIARAILIDALRRRSRTPIQLPSAGDEPLDYEIPARDAPVDAELVADDVRAAIQACLEELPEAERLVVELERQRGAQTPPPVQRGWAEQNGYTFPAYTAALNRARVRIRECLTRRLGEQG